MSLVPHKRRKGLQFECNYRKRLSAFSRRCSLQNQSRTHTIRRRRRLGWNSNCWIRSCGSWTINALNARVHFRVWRSEVSSYYLLSRRLKQNDFRSEIKRGNISTYWWIHRVVRKEVLQLRKSSVQNRVHVSWRTINQYYFQRHPNANNRLHRSRRHGRRSKFQPRFKNNLSSKLRPDCTFNEVFCNSKVLQRNCLRCGWMHEFVWRRGE